MIDLAESMQRVAALVFLAALLAIAASANGNPATSDSTMHAALTLSPTPFDFGIEYERLVATLVSIYAGADASLSGGGGLQVGGRLHLLGSGLEGLFVDGHFKAMAGGDKAWTGGAAGLLFGGTWIPGRLVLSAGLGVDLVDIHTRQDSWVSPPTRAGIYVGPTLTARLAVGFAM